MNKQGYLIDNKKLMAEWNYERNQKLDPKNFTLGSNRKVWWKCKKGHEWEHKITDRNRGDGCPYCSNRKILIGYNDLATTDYELVKEWNYERNNQLKPTEIVRGSAKVIWWKCGKCKGEWKTKLFYRTKMKHGCPYCTNQKVLSGFNDFATKYPELAKEWNYEKNGDLKPNQLMSTIKKEVWWKGKCGHEWKATLRNRVNGDNCPYCAGHRVLEGYNDLMSQNPKLAEEWNYEKNGDLKPDQVTKSSGKKVWWKCKKGHEWISTIASRNCGNGCKQCATEMQTSLPEKIIYFYIKKQYSDAIENYKPEWLKPMELDIFIPSIKTGIEYDGRKWHTNTQKDNRKNNICIQNEINLIRIREKGCKKLNGKSKDFYLDDIRADGTHVISSLKWIEKVLNIYIDVNFDRDINEINSLIEYSEKENSLQEVYPELAKEWNYEKNGDLKPNQVTKSSGKKVWWKCENGHEWAVAINYRIHDDKIRKCPYCMNQKVWPGFNDLATIYPEVAEEWNYEKNGKIKPNEVLHGSPRKVWWKGKCGHEWEATINSRKKSGCAICNGKKILKGYNDLKTKNPEVAKEWNYERNGNLKPDQVAPLSNKRVWWKCSNGHEWNSLIAVRNGGSGCPYCSNHKVLSNYNDLKTKYPEIAREWNYIKNNGLNPQDYLPTAKVNVWWKCKECGEEYKKSIYNKVRSPKCPKCKK